jgi:ribosomal-protein-serine acetyltransferase
MASTSPTTANMRVLEEGDAEELYRLLEDHRGYLAEWLPWAAAQTLEGTREFIRKTRRQLEEDDGFHGSRANTGRPDDQ